MSLVDDIIREIEDDLRSDRLKRLWQRYHVVVYVAAVLVVLAVAAYEVWQHVETTRRSAESLRYAQAMQLVERGDVAGAEQAFEVLGRDAGGRGYGTLARLYDADLRARQGDVEGALQRYDAVAADGGVERLLRDLAILLGAGLRVDRDDPASVIQRLQPLLVEDNTWRFSARELVAVAALRAGNRAEARTNLARLSDDAAAPPGIRARAAELLKTLGD
jgi:hypothetical protein